MSGIVCAVRGGAASKPTIRRAVQLAQESGLPIHFLYVVNLDFLSHTSSSRVHTIEEEMREMGEFILLTAQEQAARGGVEAHGVVRDGSVGDQIVALCRETEAQYVVLGRPRHSARPNVFDEERLQRFVERIASQTGAQVVLVGEDVP